MATHGAASNTGKFNPLTTHRSIRVVLVPSTATTVIQCRLPMEGSGTGRRFTTGAEVGGPLSRTSAQKRQVGAPNDACPELLPGGDPYTDVIGEKWPVTRPARTALAGGIERAGVWLHSLAGPVVVVR